MVLDLVSVTSTTGPALRTVQYERKARLPDEVGDGDNEKGKEVVSQNAMACGGQFSTRTSRSAARVLSQSKRGESYTSASERGNWSYSTVLASMGQPVGRGIHTFHPTESARKTVRE